MPGDENDKTTAGRAFRVGEWLVEPPLDQATRGAEIHKLEPRTMRLLVCLAETPGEVVSSQQLLEQVWSGVIVGPASIYQAVSQLRKLFDDTEDTPAYIATVPRKGYRLVATVSRPAPASTAKASPAETELPVPGSISIPRRASWPWIAGAALLAAATLLAIAYFPRREAPSRTPAIAASIPTVPALAVLPIRSEPGSPDAACGPAVTLLLIDRFSAVRDLRLIARESTFKLYSPEFDARELGGKLHARYLLHGDVNCAQDRVQAKVSLVATTSGASLWSMTFDRPSEEISAVRDEIVQRVLGTMNVAGDVRSEAGRAPVRLDAYKLYAAGTDLIGADATIAETGKAAVLFSRATALDPGFARGYLGVGKALSYSSSLRGGVLEQMTQLDKENAERAYTRALELDPALGEAWVGLATLGKDQKAAEQQFRKGLELAPNYSVGSMYFSWFLSAQGRTGEAIKVIESARVLDPNSALLTWLNAELLLTSRSDLDGTERLLNDALELDPELVPARKDLAYIGYQHRGQFAQAAAVFERVAKLTLWTRAMLVFMYLDMDDPDAALDTWKRPPEAPGFPFPVLSIYLGDPHTAAVVGKDVLAGDMRGFYGLAARHLRDEAVLTGEFQNALSAIEVAYRRQRDTWTEHNNDRRLGIIYAHTLILAGRKVEGEELARTLLTSSEGDEVGRPAHWFSRERATLYVILGDDERALAELEASQSINDWTEWWYTAERDPAFAHLHTNPRFRALAEAAKRKRAEQRALLEEMRRKAEVPRRG